MTIDDDREITDADFERIGWHDNLIYGIAFDTADPPSNDWTSDLALDIDHILEWVRSEDEHMRFRVAPARLTFHGVTDFAIAIDWGLIGSQIGLQLPSIDRIERHRATEQKVNLDRPYYVWRIALNAPHDGYITFGAAGFTQRLRAEPILQDQQWIAPARRRAMLMRSRRPPRGL